MPKLRDKYKTAKGLLFYGNKRDLAKATGMSERSIYDKKNHIERLRATELARIIVEQDMDPEAAMVVIRNLAQ